jgi:hypothetical protein
MAEDERAMSAIPGTERAAERCLNGSLKSITVSELLHFLALHRKSGKLTLRRRQGSGLVVLRNGSIIYAASSSVREAFGNILVCRDLISEATLTEALERQQWSGEDRRLGAVLIEMGALREEDVREVVRYQVASMLAEVDQWRDGFFRFDAMNIPAGGEIEVDAQDFVVTEGLNTEEILLQVATKLDESAAAVGASTSPPASRRPLDAQPAEATSLQRIVEELPTLVLHGELSQMIMRRASSAVNRGILFIVREDVAVGIGHFGLPPQSTPGLQPEALRLPLGEPSVLSDVVQHQEGYHGPLPPGSGNERLMRLLGGGQPSEVLALPVLVGGRAELVLYGDNVPGNDPIGPHRSLELVLGEAGLQIERDMLDTRTRSLERARRNLDR